MLMVVMGAGASFDSSSSYLPNLPFANQDARLPLADELFENRNGFAAALDRFPACKAIIPLLRSRPQTKSVEQVLQTLLEEATHYPNRHRQLTAIRYYLQFALWSCEELWYSAIHGITNQISLFDEIRRCWKPGEKVIIVTFNYDTLVERAIFGSGFRSFQLTDYISNNEWSIIKLHGSVNWVREVDGPVNVTTQMDPNTVAETLIDNAANLSISQRYRITTSYPGGGVAEMALLPAITIPVQTKNDFECPQEHIDHLKECVPQIDKLLLVGWRATEQLFLKLLSQGLKKAPLAMIVAGSKSDIVQTEGNLSDAKVPMSLVGSEIGFSNLIIKRSEEVLQSFCNKDSA